MKTKTGHKLKAPRTFKSNTRKVCCTLLASCILFSSCGKNADSPDQDLTQGMTTTAPQKTLFPSLTPTNTPKPTPTPEPTPTNTPIPTSTPEPTPALDFTFLPQPDEPDKTSLLDYMSQEELDAAFSLSYDPDSPMQLYARYQGQLFSPRCYYCIDLICVNRSTGPMLINIKILSGWYRFLKDGDSILLQNVYYYAEPSQEPESSEGLLQIVDLNGDGYDDFIFDFGIIGIRNKYFIAFVYDVENAAYVLLGDFYTATYISDGQTICEESYSPMGYPSQKYKYLVVGTEAILTEFIDYLDDSYTYQKLIDGELVTVLEDATYRELCEMIVDFETWRTTPASLE